MLLFASAGVFHHAGIKIPYFAFFAHDAGIRTSEPPINMLLAMLLAAIACIGIGVYPQLLYQFLPYDTGYNPYDASHVLAQTQLLFFSALAFVWLNLKGLYPPELRSVNLDSDWLYRRACPRVVKPLFDALWHIDESFRYLVVQRIKKLFIYLAAHHDSRGISRTRPTGSMVLWVAVMLATYLVLSFIQGP
jgi:multicomponent Na+:H+ antiporter subunit D